MSAALQLLQQGAFVGCAVSVRSTPLLRPVLAPAGCGSLLGSFFAKVVRRTREIC